MNPRIRTVLLAATLSVTASAFAQQPAAANPPQARPAAPRMPYGNEMGFFRPQADPALTRFVPAPAPTQPEPAPMLRLEPNPENATANLEERLEKEEQQMDRAESEHALAKAQANPYSPPGSQGFTGAQR